MKLGEYIQKTYPELSEENIRFILWNRTCFPMGGYRILIKQFDQAVRAMRNRIEVCDMCEMKIGYCNHG